MTYVSVIFSEEAAPACIRELGVLGCMQFTDLNPELTPFQRRYVTYVKRCDEIERKIRYLNGEVKNQLVLLMDSLKASATKNKLHLHICWNLWNQSWKVLRDNWWSSTSTVTSCLKNTAIRYNS